MRDATPTYATLPRPDVPPEQRGSALLGACGHLGAPAAYAMVLAVAGVSWRSALWGFLAVSAVFAPLTLLAERLRPSIALPRAATREVLSGFAMVFVKGLLAGGAAVALGWWILRAVLLHARVGGGALRIAAAVVATDFGYYLAHRFLSHGRGGGSVRRLYRRAHAAHHDVRALDFLRGNESSWIDTALSQFQPALVLASYALGLDLGATLAAYGMILLLQATDHTSVTDNIGWLRYVFMDNHAHKLHHCKRGGMVNHAAPLSIFDRLFGTYDEDWSLSSNYLHHHGIALPIRPAERPAVASMTPRGPCPDPAPHPDDGPPRTQGTIVYARPMMGVTAAAFGGSCPSEASA
jgi:sterol desaturase/sphingolipid hydroxylase (fatty acid hydroxylase superfamily)